MWGAWFRLTIPILARLWCAWSLGIGAQALAKKIEVLFIGEYNDRVRIAGVEDGQSAALPFLIADAPVEIKPQDELRIKVGYVFALAMKLSD
jgi:hypothetical protein